MRTIRQMSILKYIYEFSNRNGYQPTTREVMKEIGITSTSTMFDYLHRLKKYGYVDFQNKAPRTLHLTKKGLEQIKHDK